MIPNLGPACRLQETSLVDHALAYARRGWSIIPVHGKKSTGLWKPFQRHPANEQLIRRQFAKKGATGLAVILGRVSGGLAVRDFDDADAYHAWAQANPGDAARLPTVKTPRGFHVYGRLDAENFIKYPDGELRADRKHYVVLPPSIHPSGEVYIWIIPLPGADDPLPILPFSLQSKTTQADSADPSIHIACAHPPVATEIQVDEAIARTLPTGPGQRNRRLFDLARELKGIMPEAKSDQLRAIVREWFRRALPFIRTKEFDESWADFVTAWQKAKKPAGRSFRVAQARAERETAPSVAEQYDGHLRELVALCWQLQIQWGDSPFPLGCRTAGEALGVSRVKARRLLKVLRFDGVLGLVMKGTKKSGKASEWRFIANS
jgi:hypothetical protein